VTSSIEISYIIVNTKRKTTETENKQVLFQCLSQPWLFLPPPPPPPPPGPSVRPYLGTDLPLLYNFKIQYDSFSIFCAERSLFSHSVQDDTMMPCLMPGNRQPNCSNVTRTSACDVLSAVSDRNSIELLSCEQWVTSHVAAKNKSIQLAAHCILWLAS